jgi:hypothetical protein
VPPAPEAVAAMTDQGSGGSESRRSAPGAAEDRRAGQDRRAAEDRRAGEGGPTRPDFVSEFQRWLLRSSAKNMRREIEDQFRRTFGGGRQDTSDVWEAVTSEPPQDEAQPPECEWCPICRAARRMRESGPGLGSPLSGAGEAMATAVQDAIAALDSILSRPGPPSRPSTPSRPDRPSRPGTPSRPETSSRPGETGPANGSARAGAGPGGTAGGSAGAGSGSRESTAGGSAAAGSGSFGSGAGGEPEEPGNEPDDRG